MKLTLSNIKHIRDDTESGLEKYVCDYIIDEWAEYDDKKCVFTDVLYHGCQSGMVGSLVWYNQTVAFYNDNKDEINELLYNVMSDCGIYSPKDLFGDKWEIEDPLAVETYNQNLLAWFGFEETLRNVALKFDELQDCV